MTFNLDTIGKGLVFAESIEKLTSALNSQPDGGTAVVQAPPGTGKTTLVPPLLANLLHERGVSQPHVVVTQPRRVAARSAARRLAALDAGSGLDQTRDRTQGKPAGGRAGGRVGYTVRGESTSGPETVVEFVTPGILLRRLLSDPGLDNIHAVVLDEAHERGLETDLLLGMLAEVRELRGDLVLVAMSATLDTPRFAALLGRTALPGAATQEQPAPDGGRPAPVVDCPSALHPLTVEWVPASTPRLDGRGVTRSFLDHIADTAERSHAEALANDQDVDALVFVPGVREVSDVAARLRSRVGGGTEVLELHGQATPEQQDRAVSGRRPGGRPRIIVSTALAESSLTVPGVRLVVDSGLSREPRRDAGRGMSGLVTVSCSRASAEQRAGRAARQGPGTVVRCYDEQAFAAAPAHQVPEISVADLTGAALLLACWGAPRGDGLALPDAPPMAAMDDAVEVLRELGAVTSKGAATDLGKTLVRIPADPRLARALLDGSAVVGPRPAAEAVALVSGEQRAQGADLTRLLSALKSGSDPGYRRFAEEAKRFESIARQGGTGVVHSQPPRKVAPSEAPGFVVALAFPDRIARRVPGDGATTYLLTSGTRAGLPAGSSLAGHDWLAVAEVSRAQGRDAAGTGAVIRSAAPIPEELAIAAAPDLLEESVKARFERGKVSARQERRLGALVLASTPVRPGPEDSRIAVAEALAKTGLSMIGWSAAADGLRRRLALLHHHLGNPWPDVSEPALLARLDEWLAPELEALAGGKPANALDLAEPLRRLLPWPEAVHLDNLAPERLEVPSGSRVRIDYPEADSTGGNHDGGRPVVAVKLQECFGWASTPRLVDGRVPVLFHLLSPAGRPLA
ncbi:MAG TPA: ATP-dependent helicase C-terminal domain-containing protein, partial [Arthrobacter sp.]|nr:ATP-dependent helicase C-terminal domain-containing protein [Arthrobacter sp.]